MVNKISVVIDVAVDKANTALGNFKRSLADADGAADKMKAVASSALSSVQANAGSLAMVGGAALVAFGAKAVTSASKLEESTNAVNKSYGGAAEKVLALGDNAAEMVGLSQSAFNEAAVAFASFAKTVAGPAGDVAGTINDLTTRTADFASVMNIDVAEASAVFRSGLSGETEPLKKFGIDLSAAAVEAYALSSGLVKSKKEMTEAVKVQARYGLLMQETGKFAGDFADTQDGLANSSRVLGAKMEDLSAKVGETLTPSIATAVGWAIQFLDVMDAISGIPSTPLPGVDEKDLQSWRDYEELQREAASGNKEAQDAMLNGAKSLDVFDEALGNTTQATRIYEEGITRQSDADGIRAAKTKDSTIATEEATEAAEEAAKAEQALADRIDEARRAVEDKTNAILESLNSDLAYRNQVAETTAKLNEYLLVEDDATTSIDEHAAAARDAEGAVLAQAAAAVTLADDQATANGVTLSAEEKARIYKDELFKLAGFMDGPAHDAIVGHIEALNKIPGEINTRVVVSGRRIASNSSGNIIAGEAFSYGASGGIVTKPTLAVIGEAGPEAVVPLNRTPGSSPLPAITPAGQGGGDTFNITINDASDPDRVVQAIRQFVRRNGPIQGIT